MNQHETNIINQGRDILRNLITPQHGARTQSEIAKEIGVSASQLCKFAKDNPQMPLATKLEIATKLRDLAPGIVVDSRPSFAPFDGPYRSASLVLADHHTKIKAYRGTADETRQQATQRLVQFFTATDLLFAITMCMTPAVQGKAIVRLLGLAMTMSFDLDTRAVSRDAIRKMIKNVQDLLEQLKSSERLEAAVEYHEWVKAQATREDLTDEQKDLIGHEKHPHQYFHWGLNYGYVALTALGFNLQDHKLMDSSFEAALNSTSRASYAPSGEWSNLRQVINELMNAGEKRGLVYSHRAAEVANASPSANLDYALREKNLPDINEHWMEIVPDLMKQAGHEPEPAPPSSRLGQQILSILFVTALLLVGWRNTSGSATAVTDTREMCDGHHRRLPCQGSHSERRLAGNVSDARSIDLHTPLPPMPGTIGGAGLSCHEYGGMVLAGNVSDARSHGGVHRHESGLSPVPGNVSDV